MNVDALPQNSRSARNCISERERQGDKHRSTRQQKLCEQAMPEFWKHVLVMLEDEALEDASAGSAIQ